MNAHYFFGNGVPGVHVLLRSDRTRLKCAWTRKKLHLPRGTAIKRASRDNSSRAFGPFCTKCLFNCFWFRFRGAHVQISRVAKVFPLFLSLSRGSLRTSQSHFYCISLVNWICFRYDICADSHEIMRAHEFSDVKWWRGTKFRCNFHDTWFLLFSARSCLQGIVVGELKFFRRWILNGCIDERISRVGFTCISIREFMHWFNYYLWFVWNFLVWRLLSLFQLG